jgi:hypothetical protein
MVKFLRWHIEDLAVYVPDAIKRWWAWRQLGRIG